MINEVIIERRYISRSYYIRKCGGGKEGVFEEIRQCIVKGTLYLFSPSKWNERGNFQFFWAQQEYPNITDRSLTQITFLQVDDKKDEDVVAVLLDEPAPEGQFWGLIY